LKATAKTAGPILTRNISKCVSGKLETSNLAQGWMAVSSNEKNTKFGQRGSCGRHVHLSNFGTPVISRKRLTVETSHLAYRWRAVSTKENNRKLGQKSHLSARDPFF